MKFLLLSLLGLPLFAQAAPQPRSKLPIMGWSSWNNFRIHIDEALIREHAQTAGFPANSIAEVRSMIDPTTAE